MITPDPGPDRRSSAPAATTPINDPRAGRFRPLVRSSRIAVGVALALALAGTAVPGTTGDRFDTAAVAVVMIAPLLRVGWLAQRWFRRGDTRFGLVALGVLAVVGFAVALAALGPVMR